MKEHNFFDSDILFTISLVLLALIISVPFILGKASPFFGGIIFAAVSYFVIAAL